MPTEGEKLKIRRLVASGRSYQQIAEELPGWTAEQARFVAHREGYVVPKSKPRGDKKRLYCNGEFGMQAAGVYSPPIVPSAAALAEREKAMACVDTRDLTARIFGDPLPGRSALDKRHA